MYTEQFIEGTRGQTICYNGERYTLEEDIHLDWPTYRDGTDKCVYAPIEPWALLESDPGVYREAHWYLCSESELDAWISASNWSDKLAGILTFDDDRYNRHTKSGRPFTGRPFFYATMILHSRCDYQ